MRVLAAALAASALVASAVLARTEAKVEPTFGRLGHIHGYLINPAGEGLAGTLSLRSRDGRKLSLHHSVILRKGRFDMDNLLPGEYLVQVEAIGFNTQNLRRPQAVRVEVRPGKVSRPRVVALPGDF